LPGGMIFAAVAQHADQQFEARPPVVAAQRQNGLRVEPETVVAERIAQLADHQDVGVAPDDALVGILEHLDAVAAAVLGCLAGDLRRGQRVRERIVGAADRRDTEANGHFERALSGARHDGGGGGANFLGERRRLPCWNSG
jgi:type III secretion system FlhB-like substrate exporter